jgi:hypothetical protein
MPNDYGDHALTSVVQIRNPIIFVGSFPVLTFHPYLPTASKEALFEAGLWGGYLSRILITLSAGQVNFVWRQAR